jgi:hypothetical protein
MSHRSRWEYLRAIYARYRQADRRLKQMIVNEFCANTGYNRKYAIRTRQPVVEDPVFGFRAAGAALLSNVSYESGKPARWDPDEMKLL